MEVEGANGEVIFLTESSQIAVVVRAQWKYAKSRLTSCYIAISPFIGITVYERVLESTFIKRIILYYPYFCSQEQGIPVMEVLTAVSQVRMSKG